MKLVAITTIERATKPGKDGTENQRRVRPQIETISAGQEFEATKEEGEELVKLGAAREAKAAPKPASKTTAKKSDDSETDMV